VNPRTTLRARQENFGGTEASLDGGDEFLREGIERWGSWLLGADAQGLGRREAARLVWRGVAAKQPGVGDVLRCRWCALRPVALLLLTVKPLLLLVSLLGLSGTG
jgi:hypothetical protein